MSSQDPGLVRPQYWYPKAALEEVPHGVADEAFSLGLASAHRKVPSHHACHTVKFCADAETCAPELVCADLGGVDRSVVEFAVAARLGHRQRTRRALFEGPRRRRSARPERAGGAGITPVCVARGAGSGLFARHGVRVAGAMTVAPAHQVNVDMVVVIDVRARSQNRAELITGRRLHIVQKSLLLGRAMPAVLDRD